MSNDEKKTPIATFNAEVAAIEGWKSIRDEMVKHLRTTVTADMSPEMVTLTAKLEVKLNALQSEKEFELFNNRAEAVTFEVMQLPQVRLAVLTKLVE